MLYAELSMNSAEAVLLTAFGAFFFKEVSRSQLESAAKSLLPQHRLNQLKKADKADFLMPLAEVILKKGIVTISKDCDIKNLSRGDLKKVGPF